jgi:RNA polymerase sigma-70 factor (ECF subfamily)
MSTAVAPVGDGVAAVTLVQDGDASSDTDLVREVIAGAHDALAVLYDRHSSVVFAVAMRTTRDRWMAGEVVQETFLALWDRAERFDPERGTLAAWLITIARNRSIDHLRAAGRHQRVATFSSFGDDGSDTRPVAEWLTESGELVSVATEVGPEVALADKETRSAIVDALDALDPLERQVLVLAYQAGLTQAEIAVELGWPIGTVKTRTRRALRRMREQLEASAEVLPVELLPAAGA